MKYVELYNTSNIFYHLSKNAGLLPFDMNYIKETVYYMTEDIINGYLDDCYEKTDNGYEKIREQGPLVEERCKKAVRVPTPENDDGEVSAIVYGLTALKSLDRGTCGVKKDGTFIINIYMLTSLLDNMISESNGDMTTVSSKVSYFVFSSLVHELSHIADPRIRKYLLKDPNTTYGMEDNHLENVRVEDDTDKEKEMYYKKSPEERLAWVNQIVREGLEVVDGLMDTGLFSLKDLVLLALEQSTRWNDVMDKIDNESKKKIMKTMTNEIQKRMKGNHA